MARRASRDQNNPERSESPPGVTPERVPARLAPRTERGRIEWSSRELELRRCLRIACAARETRVNVNPGVAGVNCCIAPAGGASHGLSIVCFWNTLSPSGDSRRQDPGSGNRIGVLRRHESGFPIPILRTGRSRNRRAQQGRRAARTWNRGIRAVWRAVRIRWRLD